MRVQKYLPESPELLEARWAEEQAHRQFMYWSSRAENNLRWSQASSFLAYACFSHAYDAKVAA